MTSRSMRFRAPARPFPTCTSRSRKPWPAMTRRWRRAHGRWTRSHAFAAFERQDFAAAIDALKPIAGELERLGGSRAQLDLVEFTLLKAYLGADRLDDAHRMVSLRRPNPSGIPVAGLAAVH